MTAHCRIGRVHYKAKNITVFHKEPREHLCERMIKQATIVADMRKDTPLDGFAMVAWWKDGARTDGWAVAPDSPIGETMIPTLAHAFLTRSITDPREE